MGNYILALDQGTTSSRAIVFDRAGGIAGQAQHPFEQIYPQAGWVEHDPMEIWDSERRAAAEAIAAIPAGEIAGIGEYSSVIFQVAGVHGGGSPIMEDIAILGSYDMRKRINIAKHLAGIEITDDDKK